MTTVFGIDPSLTGFALTIGFGSGQEPQAFRWKTDPASTPRARVHRYRRIVNAVAELAREYRPELLLVEGYSFGSPQKAQQGHHDRAELRGVLYDALDPHVGEIVEVSPGTIKKFATGKGSGNKAAVVSALAARYGRTFATDDDADAFALLHIGLALVGAPDPRSVATEKQREAIETVRAAWKAQIFEAA